ncbi:MAG: hypothetical protein JWN11_723 [Hyphomicrobiales bacterium]|nr:hypothetical protein [Hyphomicrobiales bacterium]
MTVLAAESRAEMLNKVPKVTVFFWIIKLLAVTVGETAADYMNLDLGLGLTNTSLILAGLLAVALIAQFMQNKYVPAIYWTTVVLISVVGTLVTDNLSDNLGVPLLASTIGFSIALAITFAVWFSFEKTLSIHSIFTRRREAFYWLAILFTFALGTAAGDLTAEQFGLGYLETGLIFGGVIALIAVCYFVFKIDAILAFWLAYVLTRPLGASIGDWFSQDRAHGGLALGTVGTSYIFLGAIAVLVIFLSLTRRDEDFEAKV